MAYSELGVVNLALLRLGVKVITSGDWASPSTQQAIHAYAAWEYVRDEVLEACDWAFAKSRITLSKVLPRVDLNCGDGKHLYVTSDKYLDDTLDISIEIFTNSSDALSVVEDSNDAKNIQIKLADTTNTKNTAALIQTALRALATVNGVSVASWTVTANSEWSDSPPTNGVDLDEVDMASAPAETYDYAYKIPTGFLRVAHSREDDQSVDQTGAYGTRFDENGMIVIRGQMYDYVIESLPDTNEKVLLTNYDNSTNPLEFVYIYKVTDPAYWSATFVSAVAYRLAAELSLPLTEGNTKYAAMMEKYDEYVMRAKALNQTMEKIMDETGSTAWEYAGR